MKIHWTGGNKSKISYTQAQEIRELFTANKYGRKELAVLYSISEDNVSKIIRGDTHKRQLWKYEDIDR